MHLPSSTASNASPGSSHAVEPVFILSLPRSGSTLVQRVLAAHDRVSTAAEPSFLLPVVYALRSAGVIAEYRHRTVATAVADWCEVLPGGEDAYLAAAAAMARRLYTEAAQPGTDMFVDKTPRYSLIVDQIIRMFPRGRFIFLWRNPLGVVASMIGMHNRGWWNLHRFQVDLFIGLSQLIQAAGRLGDAACGVRFEDLLTCPDATWPKVMGYLGLDYDLSLLERFTSVNLRGRLGDQRGIQRYRTISTEPIEKWKQVLRNPLRRRWCQNYLHWLGESRLAAMGYSLDELLGQLHDAPCAMTSVWRDASRIVRHGWPRPDQPRLQEGRT